MESKIVLARLSALAHEGRLALFRLLVTAGPEGAPVGALARSAGVNMTTASAQLSILANAGLVAGRREGRSVIYAADFGAIRSLIAFLLQDCCQGRPEVLGPLAELTQTAAARGASEGDLR